MKTFSGHSSLVNSVDFFPDGSFILSGSRDGSIKLWNVSTGKCLVTIFPMTFHDTGYKIMGTASVCVTENAYFNYSGKRALKYFHFAQKRTIIPAMKLADQYYRPNLIKRLMANEDYLKK